MRFLVDENLSPRVCRVLHELGHDATSVRDRGLLGASDAAVLEVAVAEDRIIVTATGDDYRLLVGHVELHPGLVILPNAQLTLASQLLRRLIEHVEAAGEPADDSVVNRVLTVAADGGITTELIPPL